MEIPKNPIKNKQDLSNEGMDAIAAVVLILLFVAGMTYYLSSMT